MSEELHTFEARLCQKILSNKVVVDEDCDNPQFELTAPAVIVRQRSCCLQHFALDLTQRNNEVTQRMLEGRVWRMYQEKSGKKFFAGYLFDPVSVNELDIKLHDEERGL